MIVTPCPVEGGADHIYPDDWIFGGSNNVHPGADPRWEPTVYEYYDQFVRLIVRDATPICDDVALDNCTLWAERSAEPPVYIFAVRPDSKRERLPWEYDALTDSLHPVET